MKHKPAFLFSVFFFLVLSTNKAQVFTELHSFKLYADSATNYSSIWMDVDQDYDLDLLNFSILNKPNSLYVQDENGFKKVNSVFDKDGGNANGACYADIDMDGDLDVFVYSIFGQKNYLYIQESKGLFRKEVLQEITQQENNAFYASFSDVNLDNYPDLIIADTELWNPKTIKKPSRIYYNDGRGNFTKAKSESFFVPKSDTRNVMLADVNQDAREDLMLLNFGSENTLYLKNNANIFNKVSSNMSIIAGDYVDAKAADVDNDGDLDILLVNLKTGIELYRNDGNLLFTMVPDVFKLINFPIAGIEIIDYNNDGNMDVLLHKSFSKEKKIFINQNDQHQYIKFKLRADRANLHAIGAKVYVSTLANDRKYWQYKEVRANKQAYVNDVYDLHFGIADMKNIDTVKVIWPDGTEQFYADLLPNQSYFIEQGMEVKLLANPSIANQTLDRIKDMSVSVVAHDFTYGEIDGITVFYENKGLVQQDVEVSINLSVPMNLFNSFPMPNESSTTQFVWKIKSVPAQYRGIITLSVRSPNIEETAAIEQKIEVMLEPRIGDEQSSNNEVVLVKKIK
jgi:hypothetical protein